MPDAVSVDSYPLAPLQLGMLFHFLEGTNRGVDIEQMVGDLHEVIDVELLRSAWQFVADRHAVMRTRFAWHEGDQPRQEVLSHVTAEIAHIDLQGQTEASREQAFDDFMTNDRLRAFELDVAPFWRLTLFTFAPDHSRFVFTYHHSILDTSVVWMVQEAFQKYDALKGGGTVDPPERLPFRDHIMWLQQHVAENRQAAADYYRSLLEGVDEHTSLSALSGGELDADQIDTVYGALRFELDVETSRRIHELRQTRGLNVAAIVETAWALVLAAFSGATDVVFGSTRGCRRSGLPGSDTVMGLLINTPPVRVRIDPVVSVGDLLDSVRRQQIEKRSFEHTPLSDIQAAVGVQGGGLFETIVVANELHQGTRLRMLGGEFEHRRFDLHDQTNFPLTLLAYGDPQIHLKLSYDRRRFNASNIDRVRELVTRILEAIPTGLDQPISDLPRIPVGDLAQLTQWNETHLDYPATSCLAELFEAQVDRTPDADALIFRDTRVTYGELDAKANGVAAQLRALGVGPDSMVGVYMERSVSMVVAMLGILKAGAAYVPMDPVYPSIRIAMMIEDSQAPVVITQSHLRSTLPHEVANVVVLDDRDDQGVSSTDRCRVEGLTSSNLAYVIFTSGSTGRPKGVMIEHRNVVNFLAAMDEQLGFDPTAPRGRWLAVTSISFDISVLEIFWTLTRGLVLVMQEDEGRYGRELEASSTKRVAPMEFSLFYFAADAAERREGRYRLLLEGAKYADQHGFTAIWTPERHFHEFGGLYPNSAVTSAAIAATTQQISIRAGSVVLPLHNPIRCAEDWSIVDNLSNGRVGLSFASGWHANDFALAPQNFANRREVMAQGIETVRALWRGESVSATSGDGSEITVKLFPEPVQSEPPIWITAGGSPDTFAMAGRIGARILTNLLVMSRDDLVRNVQAYRAAYREAGHAGDGHVTLMLHTYVSDSLDDVRSKVREPFLEYLRTSTDLINRVRWEQTSFAKPTSGAPSTHEESLDELSDEDMAAMMDHAFERYFGTAGLFGTVDSCIDTINGLSDLGVNEVACLIDFGVDEDSVLASLEHLNALRERCERDVAMAVEPEMDDVDYGLVTQIARHSITHLQCTPSLAAIIASQPGGIGAIASLEMLLLGGEALPPALVDSIRSEMSGQLLNMYGPTETTIWSTVSPVRAAGEPITIGRPIANTQIYIADRAGTRNPIGVPGELLIGGDGVVRGYLDRPQLTDEKFVTRPYADGRVYRTGDLARFRSDGEIDFLGRLDHQVKIRGYRIELGEIETAIGRHPQTAETVVVARTDTAGEPRLVAYVVAREASERTTNGWADVWDETYRSSSADDVTFDISGWNDSFSGAPIPRDEMIEWVDETVGRIGRLGPKRVLEIGCGTGLLLFRLVQKCERYVGIDLSPHALDRIRSHPSFDEHVVDLIVGQAHDVARLVDEQFDTIIINSVAQYFPDAEYFVNVVTAAMGLLSPGGSLFLGDLRSLAHEPLFAAAVELARATPETERDELRQRATRRQAHEEELIIHHSLFDQLKSVIPTLASVEVSLKSGRADNELTRYRYDVVLRRNGGPEDDRIATRIEHTDKSTAADLRQLLDGGPPVLIARDIPNGRLLRDAALVNILAQEDHSNPTVGDIDVALAKVGGGTHPDDLLTLHEDYTASATWSQHSTDRFDVIYRSRLVGSQLPLSSQPASQPWTTFTNQPAVREAANLGAALRAHVRELLPDYMVPTAFVVLDALPRTPNGKIDRNALPAPDRGRSEEVEAVDAANDLERSISAIWQDMLSLDTVGVETNLFDLGANSLMVVRASARLTELIGTKVPLVDLFRYPTIRALAEHLDHGPQAAAEQVQQTQDRAQSRREAMQRRRETRRRPS